MTGRWPRTRRLHHSGWPPLLAAVLVLVVYVATLAPTVFGLDSPELAAAAYTLGLVHAPGYPVYLLLAHLFTYLPLGDVAYRVNLFSAVATTLGVALVTMLVGWLARRTLAAVVAGLSFGLCFYVWSMSVVAEVYALQGLFLAAILVALYRWRQRGSLQFLAAAAGLFGIALANSPAAILWAPGLALMLLTGPLRGLTRRGWTLSGVLFALGLGPLLYLPWRSAAGPVFAAVGEYDAAGTFHSLDLTDWNNLVWYVSGRQFEWLVLAYPPQSYLRELGAFLYRLWAAFLGVGLPLGLWGVAALWRRDRWLALSLVLAALPHALFFTGYAAPDKDLMFVPVFLVWAVFLGVGLAEMERVLSPSTEGHAPPALRRDWLSKVAVLVQVALPITLLLVNLRYASVRETTTFRDQAEARLAAVPRGAFYLAGWGDAGAMQYLQVVAGRRPDVTVVNVFFARPAVLRAMVDNALDSDRAVYVAHREAVLFCRDQSDPGPCFDLLPVSHGYRVYEERRP